MSVENAIESLRVIMSRRGFKIQQGDILACELVITDIENLYAALKYIAALDPEKDSDEGFNEWGEADCFRLSQQRAKAAIKDAA